MLHIEVYSDFTKTIEEFKNKLNCKSIEEQVLKIEDPYIEGMFFYGTTSMGVDYFYFDIEIIQDMEISRAASLKGIWTLSLSHGTILEEDTDTSTMSPTRPVNTAEFHNLKKNETFSLKKGGALRFSSFRLQNSYFEQSNVNFKQLLPFLKVKKSVAYHDIMDKNMLVIFHACFDQSPDSSLFDTIIENMTHSLVALYFDILMGRNTDHQPFLYEDHYINQMLSAKKLFSNFKTPPSLDILSQFVGMGRSQTNNLFKAVFGKTPHQFFTDLRMSEAKNYVINGRHSITEIAQFLGFASQSHFSKAFKQYYGILPKKMQLLALNKL